MKKIEETQNLENHFDLTAETIEQAFNQITHNIKKIKSLDHKDKIIGTENIKSDIKFLKSKLVKMFADCSDNFHENDMILEYHKKILQEIKLQEQQEIIKLSLKQNENRNYIKQNFKINLPEE